MRKDEQCKVNCKVAALSADDVREFRSRIEDDYRVNMCAPTCAILPPILHPSAGCACAASAPTRRLTLQPAGRPAARAAPGPRHRSGPQKLPGACPQDPGQPPRGHGQDAHGRRGVRQNLRARVPRRVPSRGHDGAQPPPCPSPPRTPAQHPAARVDLSRAAR